MKKNKMMRAASGLLVATLFTTSVISGTFAKYVTQDSATDTARVAKWGVVAAVSGDLFGATYNKVDEDGSNSITSYSINGGTVSSMAKANSNPVEADSFVVAPGTKNDTGMTLYVVGTPEVSTKITYDSAEDGSGVDYANSDIYLNEGSYGIMVEYTGVVTKENVGNYFVVGNDGYVQATATDMSTANQKYYELHDDVTFADAKYLPLVWKVTARAAASEEATTVTLTQNTVDAVDTAVKEAITAASGYVEFNPNQDNYQYANITWAWSHNGAWDDAEKSEESEESEDTDITDAGENITEADKKDTILGNMIAEQINENKKNEDVWDYDVVANGDYDVVVVEKKEDETTGTETITVTKVKYKTVNADLGTTLAADNGTYANDVVVAYTGKDYDKDNIVACLTVSFNARITVEQVD